MNTTDFVALQMREEPDDRVIPDLIYMRIIRAQTTTLLRELRRPCSASRAFKPNYLYEGVDYFANDHEHYYPNDVIPSP